MNNNYFTSILFELQLQFYSWFLFLSINKMTLNWSAFTTAFTLLTIFKKKKSVDAV